MRRLKRLFREPLVQFLLAGAVVFGAYTALRGSQEGVTDEQTIVVDRRALLGFLQFRANAFEEQVFAGALDAMSERELEALIDAYIDEEVLYREAKSLGLDQSDYVMRQRMVQKMSFLLGDMAEVGAATDEASLERYFRDNIKSYAIAPSVSFTHVFFDGDRHGSEGARVAAEASLRVLNEERAGFSDAPGRGDKFPFLRNYVERTLDYVAGHFGTDFAESLAALPPSEERWQGPLRSVYGEHVVLLTRRAESSYPKFSDVRDDVQRDYLRERARAALAEITVSLRERYRVELEVIRPEDAE